MLQDVRRFVRNCDVCGRAKAWRDRRQGFLKLLPIPSRMWRDISVDFVDKLPESNKYINLVVITDRFSKGVMLEPLRITTAEDVACIFLRNFYRRHGLPSSIVSDRGTQFVGAL